MRVTQNLLFQNLRRSLQTSEGLLLDSQEKMASQKRINRVSDDPLASGLSQATRTSQKVNDQFVRNIGRGSSTINITETYLSQMEDLVSRGKELLLSQANTATSSESTRQAVSLELASLRSQLLTLSNSRLNGVYVFGGTNNTTPPFAGATATAAAGGANGGDATVEAFVADEAALTGGDYQIRFTASGVFDVVNTGTGAAVSTGNAYVSGQPVLIDGLEITISDGTLTPAAGDVFDVSARPAGAYGGNGEEIKIEVEGNNFVALNIPGDDLFLGVSKGTHVNLFDVFNNGVRALQANDTAALDQALADFDAAKTQVSEFRTNLGARQNLFEATSDRVQSRVLDLKTERSLLEDIDLTEAATEFNKRDSAYKATLSVAARIGQVSLLDFLR